MQKMLMGLAMLSLVGCSAFKDSTQPVTILCPVPGTTVLVNGQKASCGSTVELQRDRMATLEAYAKGYNPLSRNIGYHLSTAGKWDIAGTVLLGVPAIGLLTAGAWDLDQTELALNLVPLQ